MKTMNLTFEGYWREVNKGSVPNKSGVYCVYASTYNASAGTVSLRKLLYVGESANVGDRISAHERLPDWKKRLKDGETLCYSFAPVESSDRHRAEAAVINKHKPPCNKEYKDSFPFPDTTINTSGMNAHLIASFTVYDTR